MASVSVRT